MIVNTHASSRNIAYNDITPNIFKVSLVLVLSYDCIIIVYIMLRA